jgi:hypothetical protein
MQKKIKFAAFAGIIYLISFLPELIFETLQEYGQSNDFTSTLLMISYVVSTLSTVFFFYGFIVIGNKFENNLLVVGSIIIILTTIFYYLYCWYTLDLVNIEEEVFGVSVLLLYGFSGIVFGFGLYKMRDILGKLASSAAILEIVVGFFLITVFLFFIGMILSIPATILEILLLLKAAELDKFKENSVNVTLDMKN